MGIAVGLSHITLGGCIDQATRYRRHPDGRGSGKYYPGNLVTQRRWRSFW